MWSGSGQLMRAAVLSAGISFISAGAQAQNAADRATSAQVESERETSLQRSLPSAPVPVEIEGPAPAPAAAGPVVFVGAVTFAGLEALAPQDFADIIAACLGRTLSPTELAALVNAVATRVRERGYPLGLAWIEPQRVANGVLAVRVDEGRIDEVRFAGWAPRAVHDTLAPLRDGRSVRFGQIERRLMLAADIPGVQIRKSRFFREQGTGVLEVEIARDRVALTASIANPGSKPVGPEQLRLEVDAHGLLASDDTVTVSLATTPLAPSELQVGYVRYQQRIGSAGTTLAVSASVSRVRPGAYLAPLDLRNDAWFAGVNAVHPLLRRRSMSLWLEAELGIRDLEQTLGGTRFRRDRLTVARLSLRGYDQLGGGRLRAGASVSQGLGLFGATQAGDPAASRLDADGTFTTLGAWADWTAELGGPFSLRVAAAGQLASRPLLIGEELGLGGTNFLRGYDWGERTGDEGVMGSGELRYTFAQPLDFIKQAQFYAFADGGLVSNLDDGLGGGSLASFGGGTRLTVTQQLAANFEVAVPLSGPRFDTLDRTPKFSFAVIRSF